MRTQTLLKRGLGVSFALLLALSLLVSSAIAEQGRKGILLVAFGTSEEKALPA